MSETLLAVKDLKKYFKTSNGFLHAVDNVTFTIEQGKTLGIVGESGCGKSTLGRTIIGLQDATDGQIIFDGRNITNLKGKYRHELRKEMQIIFQDPYASLDQRKNVFQLISEPLRMYHDYKDKIDLQHKVSRLMETVGLASRLIFAYPHELDGGRRQRIGIARALALNPRFIVCDEPVSALDVSIQAQILNLMMDLQDEKKLTYLFITHDMSVVKHISNDILVMYLGCVVEKSPSKELFIHHYHPYTQGLLSAIPVPSINIKRKRIILKGELSSPINPKPGCRFYNRCEYATPACAEKSPELQEITPGHFVACHQVKEINHL